MSMGVPSLFLPPTINWALEHAPDLTRARQREAFDRLEREHEERVRRAERHARIWSGIGIATFFAAMALAAFGAWSLFA